MVFAEPVPPITPIVSPETIFKFIDYISCKGVCADKVAQLLAFCIQYGVPVTLPEKFSFIYETYVVSYFEYGIHVMSVHDSSHVELLCQVTDQSVYQN